MGFGAAPLLIGLGVLLTAGIIVVLYWVRPEPQPVVVPSNLIWRRVLDERRRREDFWRWLVSLVIALLAALAVIMALSEPIPESAARGGRIAVVIDTAPSMEAALPGGGTRWERASEQVERIFAGGGETSEFLLLDTAGDRGGRSFIGRREALEALEDLAPVHGREHRFPDVADLLEPAAGTELVFVGDGVYVPEAPEGVERISVFEPVPNAGITAFDVRPLPSDPGRFEAFIEVVRHPAAGNEGGVVVLQIDGAGGASARRTVRVDPGTPIGETVPLTGFVAGPVRAVIAISDEDGLPADDVAHAYIPARNRLRVQLVGGPNPFWEAALRLDPRVSLSVTSGDADALADLDPGSVDLVVMEGAPPEAMLPVPVLFAGSGNAAWLPPRRGGETTGPGDEGQAVMLPVVRGQTEHPLLRDLNFEDALARDVAAFDAASFGERSAWTPLLGDARLGLLAARESPLRSLAFAFPIAQSNLPLQADFPLFLSRALSWLTDVEVRRVGLGQARVAMAAGAIFDADGREVPSRRLGSEISFDASEPSLYYAAGGGQEVVVAASLLDRRASSLNQSAWAGEPPAVLAPAAATANAIWPLLALFALLLIVAEWVAFHRHATV
jgi:hypothetical protein